MALLRFLFFTARASPPEPANSHAALRLARGVASSQRRLFSASNLVTSAPHQTHTHTYHAYHTHCRHRALTAARQEAPESSSRMLLTQSARAYDYGGVSFSLRAGFHSPPPRGDKMCRWLCENRRCPSLSCPSWNARVLPGNSSNQRWTNQQPT